MTSQRVFGTIAAIALLALSATAAQASGGAPSALTSFFLCKTINGDDAAQSVDVVSNDPVTGAGWGFSASGVRLGNATLACSFTKLFRPNSNNAIDPNPSNWTDLKCYAVSVPRSQTQTSTPPSYTFTDNLFPGGLDSGVTSTSVQYICAPTNRTQP